MRYTSTRNNDIDISSAEAIIRGISSDNGLFTPKEIPTLFIKDIYEDYIKLENQYERYISIATKITSLFFDDFDISYLKDSIYKAYTSPFDNTPAPIKKLSDRLFCLELYHGPTLAFKDIALQLMPFLLEGAKEIQKDNSHSLILVATSGDTGKAALEGYKDINGVNIVVFYPKDGVGEIQELQMTTQQGSNINVIAINGNFDDTQRAVKSLMTDVDLIEYLKNKNIKFTSANSINIGRLIPQIVYYYTTYLELLVTKCIKMDDRINFIVPSGNFGNILAGYLAKSMGLPIDKLICASNQNNVLTDFIRDGEYTLKRDFFTTISPSMDILVSSNVERLIWLVTGYNSNRTAEIYKKLKQTNSFALTDEEKAILSESFLSYSTDDTKTLETIRKVFNDYNYLIDPHTAVAFSAYEKYINETNSENINVVLSTASPFKFSSSVLKALSDLDKDESESLQLLSTISNTEIPKAISDIYSREVRFSTTVETGYEKEDLLVYIDKLRVNN